MISQERTAHFDWRGTTYPCPGNEAPGSQFGIALAIQPNQNTQVDPGSVIAISWHDARTQPYQNQTPATTEFGAFYFPSDGKLNLRGPLSEVTDGPNGSNVPWIPTNPGGGGNTSCGDYEGMIADTFLSQKLGYSAFYVPWADQRGQASPNPGLRQSEVFGTEVILNSDDY